jgi:hypothetical protein
MIMSKRVLIFLCEGALIFGLLLAAAWTYWNEQSSDDAWVAEQPEQIVSGSTTGEKLNVAFILRNTSSQPRRILGIEAC